MNSTVVRTMFYKNKGYLSIGAKYFTNEEIKRQKGNKKTIRLSDIKKINVS